MVFLVDVEVAHDPSALQHPVKVRAQVLRVLQAHGEAEDTVGGVVAVAAFGVGGRGGR